MSGFIDLIKDKAFLLFSTAEGGDVFRGKAGDIYLPTQALMTWFETKPNTWLLSLDEYRELVEAKDHDILIEFFDKLGVKKTPRVLPREISPAELDGQRISRFGRDHTYEDKHIDGCEQVVASINATRSILLWFLLQLSFIV